MAQAPPFSSQLYLLEDHARTLFPLTTTKVVVTRALPEIQQHITEIFDQRTSDAFLVQQRCYASKTGYHLRRTVALDPVAAYVVYDLIYAHRAKLGLRPSTTRRSFGYRFSSGRPIAPSISYGEFREAIREAFPRFKHALAFDISSYFNSIYHHDLTAWFEASIAPGPHAQFGQFLRECNKGRSIDCLPHGFHPCKAIGSAFLYDIDNSVQLECALMLRFLDDFYLFDDDEHVLNSDFLKIQQLLGERSLTLNTNKTTRDGEVMRLAPGTIDEIKVELLERRREIVVDEYGRETVEDIDEEEDDDPLTDEQLEYLIELLKDPDIDESDAELVLTVLKSRDEDVLEHLTDILERFPSLTRRIYGYSKHIEDAAELATLLDNFVKKTKTTTEDQLFWIAKIAEDYLHDSRILKAAAAGIPALRRDADCSGEGAGDQRSEGRISGHSRDASEGQFRLARVGLDRWFDLTSEREAESDAELRREGEPHEQHRYGSGPDVLRATCATTATASSWNVATTSSWPSKSS